MKYAGFKLMIEDFEQAQNAMSRFMHTLRLLSNGPYVDLVKHSKTKARRRRQIVNALNRVKP